MLTDVSVYSAFDKMFKPVRVVASVIFLGSIGLIFVGAFVLKNGVRLSFALLQCLLPMLSLF